jgi:hypothetical protein
LVPWDGYTLRNADDYADTFTEVNSNTSDTPDATAASISEF